MNFLRLPALANDSAPWRVAKKIDPGQRGAVKLVRMHGDGLLCLRYRENEGGAERLTAVGLVVERVVVRKRDNPVVGLKIKPKELEGRRLAQAKSAKYGGKTSIGSRLATRCCGRD